MQINTSNSTDCVSVNDVTTFYDSMIYFELFSNTNQLFLLKLSFVQRCVRMTTLNITDPNISVYLFFFSQNLLQLVLFDVFLHSNNNVCNYNFLFDYEHFNSYIIVVLVCHRIERNYFYSNCHHRYNTNCSYFN